jgi:hypothetical protein
MGLHDPFWHLKHKLWPKEGSKVELAIWLPITKSWESSQFPCVQVKCHILLESSWWRLQLNQRSTKKVMGPQSHKSPNFGNFRTPIWESWDKNAIWMWASWRGTKYTIRGKVVASPKSRPQWVLWIRVCPWLFLAPKVLKLGTNQIVVWFVQIRVSD